MTITEERRPGAEPETPSENIAAVDSSPDGDAASRPRGQTSSSFAWGAAQTYRHDRRPLLCLYVGDHDPAGYEIQTNLQKKLREFSGRDDLQVQRLACTAEDIRSMNLPGTTAKKTSYRDALTGATIPFDGLAVEVESIDPPVLRAMLDDAIEAHVDQRMLSVLQRFEESERNVLLRLASSGGVR